jgi:hypothetical protein
VVLGLAWPPWQRGTWSWKSSSSTRTKQRGRDNKTKRKTCESTCHLPSSPFFLHPQATQQQQRNKNSDNATYLFHERLENWDLKSCETRSDRHPFQKVEMHVTGRRMNDPTKGHCSTRSHPVILESVQGSIRKMRKDLCHNIANPP